MTSSRIRTFLFCLAILLTTAWSVAAQTPVTIEVWDGLPQTGREVFLELLEEFQQEYPHITIESGYVTGGYHAIREKFVVGWASGVVPNVIQMGNAHTYDLRYLGAFAALDDFIQNDASFDLDDWYPPFREMVVLNGKTYGIPYNVSTPITYYSPFVFEDSGLEPTPPKTWDEMIVIGKQITRDVDGDGNPDIWGTDNVRSPGWVMEAFIHQGGGRMINEEKNRLMLDSPEAVQAMEFQQALIHEHRVARYPGAPGNDLFGGKIGWWIRSTASLRNYLQRGEEAGIPVSAAPLPCGVQCYAPIGGGAIYAVNTGTPEQREASYLLISFLSRPENQARYASASGYMVTRRSALATEIMQETIMKDPEFTVTYNQLSVSHPETQAPEWGKLQLLWENNPEFLDPIFYNNLPVLPVLEDTVRKGNAILDEFWSKANTDG